MTNDATRATAQATPEINRRRFLTGTAIAGAAVAVAAPVVAAEPKGSPVGPLVYAEGRVNMWDVVRTKPNMRELVVWHIRELERLTKSAGAGEVSLMVVGHAYGGLPGYEHCKSMLLQTDGTLVGLDDMFGSEGGAA